MAQGSGVAVSCGVGRKLGSDLPLLWLWCRPAAIAPIQQLAWEFPYAIGVTLKRKKKKRIFFLCISSIGKKSQKENMEISKYIKTETLVQWNITK